MEDMKRTRQRSQVLQAMKIPDMKSQDMMPQITALHIIRFMKAMAHIRGKRNIMKRRNIMGLTKRSPQGTVATEPPTRLPQ